MTFYESGQVDVRSLVVDGILKGFAKRAYKLKTLVNVQTTGAWINYFYRASPDTEVAGRNSNVRGIPRGAAFPQASTSFEKVRTDIEKYGLQDSIPWEDIISGAVNVRDQTLMRMAEGVVYAVDRQIWNAITTDTGIQTFTIGLAAGWNAAAASANIIDDLEYAEQLIASWNYPTSNIVVVVNPRDKRSIVNWFVAKGSAVPQITQRILDNGVIGTLGNKTFVVSDVASASQALVLVPQICATWKELYPLTTDVETQALRDVRITAAELGVLQVDNPKAVVWIKGTQGPY